jgi:hypothetical protein
VLIGIDHVIVAVREPNVAVEELAEALGLRPGGGGRHAAHGTCNRLIWLGDSYLELMGVFDAALAADSWWGRHALTLLKSADAAYMGVALASDDLTADADRLRSAGSVVGEPEPGERVRPDGQAVRWRLAHAPSADPQLGLTFLIEHDPTSAEWTPAERAARAAEIQPLGTPVSLRRLELPVADIRAASMRLLRDLGVSFRPSLAGAGARDGAVGRQTIRLVRGAGLPPRIVLAGGARSVDLRLLGCDWLVEAAGR